MSYILGSSDADDIQPGFVDENGVAFDYSSLSLLNSFVNIWAGNGNDNVKGVSSHTIAHGQGGEDSMAVSNVVETPGLEAYRPVLYGGDDADTLQGDGDVYLNGNAGNDVVDWNGLGYASLSGENGDDTITASMTATGTEEARIFTGNGADTVNVTLGDGDRATVFLHEDEAAADTVSIYSDIDAEEGGLVDLGQDFDPTQDTLVVNGVSYSGDDLAALGKDPTAIDGVTITSQSEYSGDFTYLAFDGNEDGGAVTVRLSSDVFASNETDDEETDQEETTDEDQSAAEDTGNDRVEGTENADFIQDDYTDSDGDSTEDTVRINGFGGDDYIRMKNGLSHIIGGGDGNDSLYAVNGEHHVAGEAGDDLVVGGNESCLLEGGKGNDTLVGYLDHGADHEMHLGKGNDIVDLRDASDTETSNVSVTDFRFGEDQLMFDGVSVNFASLPDGVTGADDDDGNLVLSFNDDDTVTLHGQSVSSMQSYADTLNTQQEDEAAQLAADWTDEDKAAAISDDDEAEADEDAWSLLDTEVDEGNGDDQDVASSDEASSEEDLDYPTVPVDEYVETAEQEDDEDLDLIA
ncbi:calcium-binding protein (plasmid) [Thioclava sp. 'Guangxiensis']|uniref:calcium-binding protein n=1 Tax=Thioclava sp. 'Guangxiensis' TaxID=3149044 RepID=UPI0032C40744